MVWPGPNEYSQAVMTPAKSFADPQLMAGVVDYHKAGGLPQTITGNFASIYRVRGADRVWAIKCFLRNITDQSHRYNQLQLHLAKYCTQNTIGFKFLDQGIKINGEWYPVVKMDWVEGDALDWYIHKNSREFGTIADLLKQFTTMCQGLRNARIAHGDLHHGNIYVTKNGLRLLDYDGAYVPALEGLSSNELGHPNYQHPRRTQSHFGPNLDNFSAWVIYTSLFCLNIDGTLWHKLAGGDECLLFRSSDFGDPANSYTFSLLENHPSIEVRHAARTLRELCGRAPQEIPYLGEPLHQSNLGPLKTSPILPSWLTRAQEDADADSTDDNYPSFRDFNEAMKAPEQNFSDPELKQGVCILEDTRVGRNGRVYRFRCPDRNVAVKVFSRDDAQREDRYRALERALGTVASQYLIDFEFITRGVNIQGYWFPIVKMEWLNGTPAHQLPAAMMSDGLASYLADQFATMMKTLKGAGIAHGDLELNNLLVCGQDLKVVDYDTMFVPELFRLGSPELGNPGYQHSKRKKTDYAPYVDNFSAWLIHYLLKNLHAKPKLYELSEACLNEEHRGSTDHATLRALERHPEPVVAKLGRLLQIMLSRALPLIPDLHPEQSLESLVSQDTRTVSSPGGLLKRKKPQI